MKIIKPKFKIVGSQKLRDRYYIIGIADTNKRAYLLIPHDKLTSRDNIPTFARDNAGKIFPSKHFKDWTQTKLV